MHQIELQEQEDTRTRFQRLGKEQTREGAKKKKRKQINKQTNKKKPPHTTAAQQVRLITALVLLICRRGSSQNQYVRSRLFISPRKTAKLCLFECLHGLT